MKNKLYCIISVLLCVTFILSSCSFNQTIDIDESRTGGEVSRAEFVQMVYDNEKIDG